MHLFMDYVQPLTTWLHDNPNWALSITFLISFAESLAIVGSLIPGSVTMTAIGILAGSGVMNIELTLTAAAVGAVAGDGASFALGYIFSDRLTDIWPFSRYPNWLNYGKDYFAKHGGKSVIIGRFFGPLRSIIPIIAGILRMNGWHFLLANIISGIGWAIFYVVPGILIGAASTELSAESATRLFVFILAILVIAWLISQGIKWLLLHANQLLNTQLRKIWIWSNRHIKVSHFLKKLTPKHERNHYPTAGLLFLFIVCLFISIAITLLVSQWTWVAAINNPCHLFLQSLRTQYFDAFFVAISLVISPLPLLIFSLSVAFSAIYYHDWRMLRYWTSLAISCSLIASLLAWLIKIPEPGGLLYYQLTPTFPAPNLTLATALFSFLIGYANTCFRTTIMLVLRAVLATLLLLAGLALLYLGDNWASSIVAAYFIGLTICIAHWIGFRRPGSENPVSPKSTTPIILACSLFLLSSSISYPFYYKKITREHAPYLKQYVLTDKIWWSQSQPLLPLYTTNRIGNRIGLFNIQYVGSLKKFQKALRVYGWKKQPDSFFYSLLMRASGQNSAQELPLMAQLYLNKKPTLIMVYPSNQKQALYIIRLWRSNYHLCNHNQPIWLGSVVSLQATSEKKPEPFSRILPAMKNFKLNILAIPNHKQLKTLPKTVPSDLLMIKAL